MLLYSVQEAIDVPMMSFSFQQGSVIKQEENGMWNYALKSTPRPPS